MKKIIYIMTLFALLSTSCNKWLDVESKFEVPATVQFSTEQGFEDALIACYIKMNSTSLYGEELSYKALDYLAQYWANGNVYETYLSFLIYNYDSAYLQSILSDIYISAYNVIAQANLVLNALEEKKESGILSEEKAAIIKAEALALRAYIHFDILRLFGAVPTPMNVDADGNEVAPNTTVNLAYSTEVTTDEIPMIGNAAFVAKLEADLSEAASLFEEYDSYVFESNPKDDFYQLRTYRMNYYAVKALSARMYQYLGNTDKAYSYAKELIGATKEDGTKAFTLMNTTDFTQGSVTALTESMFALKNTTNITNANLLYSYSTLTTHTMPESDLDLMFEGRTETNNRRTFLWNMNYTEDDGKTTIPLYKKYLNSDVTYATHNNMCLLRLSEMYLIAMECTESLTEANEMFKEYMLAREEYIDTDFASLEEVRDMVMNEYRIEFIGEGQMFYTYKRKGTTNMMFTTATMTEANYILPLPSNENK